MSTQANYCPNCGASLNPGATFCSHCGNPVPKASQTPSAPLPPTYTPPTSPSTYQPTPSYMQPRMEAGNLGLGLIIGVLLAVTVGLIPLLGLFIAGLVAGLIARGAGRGALVGVVAGVAHWLLVLILLYAIGVNFVRLDRLLAIGGIAIVLLSIILFVLDLIVGVIGGVIGGAIHPQRY